MRLLARLLRLLKWGVKSESDVANGVYTDPRTTEELVSAITYVYVREPNTPELAATHADKVCFYHEYRGAMRWRSMVQEAFCTLSSRGEVESLLQCIAEAFNAPASLSPSSAEKFAYPIKLLSTEEKRRLLELCPGLLSALEEFAEARKDDPPEHNTYAKRLSEFHVLRAA